jgi:transcriptional regulator with XRE-family HTH domain
VYFKYEYTVPDMDRDKWSARQEFLWKLLRDVRKENKLTQIELAEKLHRKQQYVSKYELGERRLDLLEIYDICNACDITLAELVERAEPELQKYAAIKG